MCDKENMIRKQKLNSDIKTLKMMELESNMQSPKIHSIWVERNLGINSNGLK